MRRAVVLAGTVVLLVGPSVVAFFAGGYFAGPRVVAAGIAWTVVLLLAVAGPLPLPRSRAGTLAAIGLVGLAAWSALSLAWAPLIAPVVDSVERLLLYLGALFAAVALLRDPRAVRATEPLLALGALVAVGYGLAGRLVPAVVDLRSERSFGAGGRLEQPITYWNAEGLLAAMGFLLCVRLAGDPSRPTAVRAAAAAGCAPLAMGIYLSYSRGAVAVAALGIVVLLAAAPTWSQLRAAGAATLTGVAAAASSAGLPGVASLTGTVGQQERDGATMTAILAVIVVGALLLSVRAARAERSGAARCGRLPGARRLGAVAAAATACCVVALVVAGLAENAERRESASAAPARFASLASVRYEYWRVGLLAFGDQPVRGLGAGGFRVYWLKERRVAAGVVEVHSLVLEMAAELGLPGLLFLGLLLGGVAVAGRRALARGSPLAPSACAVCIAWLLHASIDWDWQLPAVTLPALVLAGGLLAASESPRSTVTVEALPAERDRPEGEITLAAG